MPWIDTLMLAIGVALIVTMICTGHAPDQRECEAFPPSLGARPALRRPRLPRRSNASIVTENGDGEAATSYLTPSSEG